MLYKNTLSFARDELFFKNRYWRPFESKGRVEILMIVIFGSVVEEKLLLDCGGD